MPKLFIHTGLRFVARVYLGGFSNRSSHLGSFGCQLTRVVVIRPGGCDRLVLSAHCINRSLHYKVGQRLARHVTSRWTLPVTRGDGLCAILCSSHFSLKLEVPIALGPQGCSLPAAPTLLWPPPPLPAAPISCLHLAGSALTNHGQAQLCQPIIGRRQTVVLAWLPVLSQPSEI